MHTPIKRQNVFMAIITMGELIFHSVVRSNRKSHRNAVVGLVLSMFQAVIFVAIFYAMFILLGMRSAPIRGDYLLYIMSGVFLFLTHNKAMGAVAGAEGPTSAMMKHAPLNTLISIVSSALSALYMQTLTLICILYLYHTVIERITIYDPVKAFGCLLLAWLSGIAVGLIFLSLKPWFPNFANVANQVYSRANMLASGKMFVANATPNYILKLFTWNPLFHCIDQARGYIFINYFPHKSSLMYPIYVSIALIMIGLMAEFFTRKRVSLSWFATR